MYSNKKSTYYYAHDEDFSFKVIQSQGYCHFYYFSYTKTIKTWNIYEGLPFMFQSIVRWYFLEFL